MDSSIDYISIDGFRSIRKIKKLALRPINVVVGANGSGKSNFVSVFSFLSSIQKGYLRHYTEQKGGADKIIHFGSKKTASLSVEISFNGKCNGYKIQLAPNDLDLFYIYSESCWFWDKENEPSHKILNSETGEAWISQSHLHDYDTLRTASLLTDFGIYHFHDTSNLSPIKKIADIEDIDFFRPDGSNLSSYLLFLKESYPSNYNLIRKTIKRVTPFFDDFRLLPLRRNENKIRLEWIHQSSPERYFDVSSLSDGTLRFICLTTLLLQPARDRPSVILIDEPELGLHPYAISMLASMIKSAATETQVILSTQSPLLLDHFEPEDILVAELEDGATTLNRLQPSDLDEWLEDYSLGQLWEKNQFGGRPKYV